MTVQSIRLPPGATAEERLRCSPRLLQGRTTAGIRGCLSRFACCEGSDCLKIAVVGTGGVGAALGMRWGAAGHDVTYGSRTSDSEKVQQLIAKSGATAAAKSPREAIAGAEAILFA